MQPQYNSTQQTTIWLLTVQFTAKFSHFYKIRTILTLFDLKLLIIGPLFSLLGIVRRDATLNTSQSDTGCSG